jgi:hypothetical protein
MKHFLSRLVPLLLPACTVDTPIVEGSNRSDDNLEAWCESFCRRGTDCGTTVPETCPTDCVLYYNETYVGKGKVCEEAAGRLMNCIDAASCDGVRTGEACNIRAEEERCLESQGLMTCPGSSIERGNEGYCNVSFDTCPDGSIYRLTCLGTTDPPECDCLIDDEVTGTFIRTRPECPEEFEVKQICAFPIADHTGDPEAPPRMTCHVGEGMGNAVSAGLYECGVTFDTCSDGRRYEVTCEGPPGAVDCYCSIDGEHLDQNQSPAGVCPFLDDPDNAAVAINYICGFRIVPTTFP